MPAKALWSNAVQHYQAGRLNAAARLCRKILQQQPCHANALLMLGSLLLDQGQHRQAAHRLQQAVEQLRVLNHAALPDAAFNLGNALFELERYQAALEAYQLVLQFMPQDIELLNNLVNTLVVLKRCAEAVPYFYQALQQAPGHQGIWRNLADALKQNGQLEDAVQVYQKLIRLASNKNPLNDKLQLAQLLQSTQDYAAAIPLYQQLLKCWPQRPDLHFNLGVCWQRQGHFQTARTCLSQAIALRPDYADAHYNLSADGGFQPDPAYCEQLKRMLHSQTLVDSTRSRLHFALATIYDRQQDYSQAFAYAQRGNAIKAAQAPFDARAFSAYIDDLIATFSAEYFQRQQPLGSINSVQAVFIVGMPRRGTSLVAQMLGVHPDFFNAGELELIPQLVQTLKQQDLTTLQCSVLAQKLTNKLHALAPTQRVIGDKLPGNYAYLVFIASLLPQARIVHVRRHPLDTCVSYYMQDFEHGQRFSYDLEHLASVYADYRRIFDHWRKVLPLPLFELDYETLVQQPEPVLRELLQFCNLSWHPGCFNPQNTTQSTATASFWQVRQPLYHSSISRYQHYPELVAGLGQQVLTLLGS